MVNLKHGGAKLLQALMSYLDGVSNMDLIITIFFWWPVDGLVDQWGMVRTRNMFRVIVLIQGFYDLITQYNY